MSARNDGGPAFPVPNLEHDVNFNGMSLRDYLAANAPETPDWFAPVRHDVVVSDGLTGEKRLIRNQINHAATFFAWRWYYADCMLTARETE